MAEEEKAWSTSTLKTIDLIGNTVTDTGLVSYKMVQTFELVNFVIVSGIIALCGIVTNTINMIIFFRQGLDTTMNISLFGLAISDFCSSFTLVLATVCFNPLFVNSGIPVETRQFQYLTVGWPHLCFGHITCWITTYITAERCLCIAMPIKVKQIVTPRRTAIIIALLYLINAISLVPEYCYSYYDWIYFPEKNQTLLGLAVRENSDVLASMGFILFAILGTASFPAVILFTAILVIKLRKQTKWRKKSSHEIKAELTSKRDIKTMNMVVLIAAILIACYTPGVVVSMAVFFVPSLNIKGENVNIYYILWTFVSVFDALNSSINIFFYYTMSTKYKIEFRYLLDGCQPRKK